MFCLIGAAIVLLRFSAHGPGAPACYRVDRAGWIYLHLAGTPHEIGKEYGLLAAKEIDDAHRVVALDFQAQPYDWHWARETAWKLFWAKLDPEYQEELQGQAEGLQSKGYSCDVKDVLAYNAFIELRDYYIPYLKSKASGLVQGVSRDSCSAFIATGSTTRDGKIVMAHSLWWDYPMGQRCNVLLDISPEHGNRILMDAFCGFIHSGSDFAINSSGVLLCETTISGFAGFDPNAVPEFMRMRKAIQYAESVGDVAKLLEAGNNGGYANTWLCGDRKTNEIGQLELGLKNVTYVHKSDGYYAGSNFPQNPKLISQEIPGGWDADPKTNGCEDRRLRWHTLLTKYSGQVDVELAKRFLGDTHDQANNTDGASGNTLCGRIDAELFGAMNSKVVDSDMAEKFSFWAKMGFSDGSTFSATDYFKDSSARAELKPFLHDILDQSWLVFPPAETLR